MTDDTIQAMFSRAAYRRAEEAGWLTGRLTYAEFVRLYTLPIGKLVEMAFRMKKAEELRSLNDGNAPSDDALAKLLADQVARL